MDKNRNRLVLFVSLISFAIVSVCLMAMYFIETNTNSPPSFTSILCGIAFWLFMIIGIVSQITVSMSVKSWCNKKKLYRSRFRRTKIGAISFFSNLPSVISDVTFIVSLIVFVIVLIIDSTSVLAYIFLSVLFLSFCTHCIFNGKNYYYIKNYEQIKAQLIKMEEK